MTESSKGSRLIVVARILFTLCIVGTIIFIFSNSAQVAQVSSGRSGEITMKLNELLGRLHPRFQLTEHIVRKLAHLTEYMMLGFWLMLTLRVYTKRVVSHISWPLFFGLLVPVADESIQMFTDGRSAEVRDVLIDFSGVLLGLFVALLLLLFIRMISILIKNKAEL